MYSGPSGYTASREVICTSNELPLDELCPLAREYYGILKKGRDEFKQIISFFKVCVYKN